MRAPGGFVTCLIRACLGQLGGRYHGKWVWSVWTLFRYSIFREGTLSQVRNQTPCMYLQRGLMEDLNYSSVLSVTGKIRLRKRNLLYFCPVFALFVDHLEFWLAPLESQSIWRLRLGVHAACPNRLLLRLTSATSKQKARKASPTSTCFYFIFRFWSPTKHLSHT